MNPLALKAILGLAVFAAVFASAGYVVRKYNAGQQAIAQVAAAEERAAAAEAAVSLLAEATAQRDTAHTNIRAKRAATNKEVANAITSDAGTAEWGAVRLPDGLRDAHRRAD